MRRQRDGGEGVRKGEEEERWGRTGGVEREREGGREGFTFVFTQLGPIRPCEHSPPFPWGTHTHTHTHNQTDAQIRTHRQMQTHTHTHTHTRPHTHAHM